MRLVQLTIYLLLLSALSAVAQPTLVKDIKADDDSSPTRFFNYNGLLLFRADSDTIGVELWKSDGTPEGTVLVKNINPDPSVSAGNSNPDNFILYNGKVYFKAKDDLLGDELWVTDGTSDGTQLVKDIQVGDGNANPFDMILFKDKFYFTANNGNESSELWVSDGTAEGTTLVVDINPGGGPGNPINKYVFGDTLYFAANDGVAGVEPWKSDGTADGTSLIKNIRETGNGNASPSQFIAYNGEIYFRANDGVTGTELWKTDGTEAGTVLVKDIREGSGSASPGDFFISQGTLFFTANDGTNGTELWKTDGTTEGTVMVADINTGGSAGPGNFVEAFPGTVYFTAENDTLGEELHRMSILPDTILIRPVADINPGSADGSPEDLVFTGNAIYFGAETSDFGRELYRLNLPGNEVERLSDINPEAGDGAVDEIILVDTLLFFEANDGTTGRELWKYEVAFAELGLTADDVMIQSGDTIDFGRVFLGMSDTLRLTLQNNGQAELSIIATSQAGSGDFSFLSNETVPGVIAAGEAFALGMAFTPSSEGEQTATFTIVSTSFPGQVFTFHLRGQSEVSSAVELIPAAVKLYPNPVSDVLTLELETPLPNATVRILNGAGQELYRQPANELQNRMDIDVSRLLPGLYVLEVVNGKKKALGKFIKR